METLVERNDELKVLGKRHAVPPRTKFSTLLDGSGALKMSLDISGLSISILE